ncbi:MAG: signal transduction histidine kinase [Pseudohongiellaceae bacterium]|jgi:signal transduction histidine kinase
MKKITLLTRLSFGKNIATACTLLLIPTIGFGIELAQLHRLSLAELEAQQQLTPKSTDVKLALVRKLGQSYQQRALDILDTIKPDQQDRSLQLHVKAMRCELNIRRGETDLAAQFCEGLEPELENESVSTISRAVALNALGYENVRAGRGTLALQYFESGLQEIGLEDDVTKVTLLHNRGVALMLSGLTEMAIEALGAADLAKDVLPSDDSLPSILAYNLGYVQAQAGNHEEALKSYLSTIPWIEETGQLTRAFIAHTQVAISYNGIGRYQEGLDELLPWLSRTDFQASSDSTAHAQLALAQAYLGLGDDNSAERALLEGIQIASNSNNPGRLRELSLVYGELLLNRNEPEDAAEYLSNLFEELEHNDMRAGLGPAHQLLTEAYKAMGNYAEALIHSQHAIEAYQQSQTDNFGRRLAALRVSNQLDLKNQELSLVRERQRTAQASQRLTRVIQMAALAGLFIILILVFLNLSRKANRREAVAQREAADRLQTEVDARTVEVEQALEQKYASDKRKAELEIRVAKDDKLRVIGQLTGGVAHDFNNIMTVVQLCSELLLINLDTAQKKLAEDILKAVNSGKAITRGLLAYARQQVLQPTTLELSTYVEENKKLFMRSIDTSIEFETQVDVSNGPLIIKVDEGQLTSTILNLVLNAKEASQSNCKILLSVHRNENRVIIRITDEGRGMAEKELEASTEPFYSTKTMAEGSGLGLSMVEGFMKQSGGDLVITSTPGKGTTIELGFVIASELPAEKITASAATLAAARYTVLLVEDEDQIRNIATMVLEQAGYQVILAENGDDAIQKYQIIENLNLLLTDLIMPGGISGNQLIAELRKQDPNLPVLLMSGYAAEIPSGYPFLSKPFTMDALLGKVRELTLSSKTEKS